MALVPCRLGQQPAVNAMSGLNSARKVLKLLFEALTNVSGSTQQMLWPYRILGRVLLLGTVLFPCPSKQDKRLSHGC